MHARLQEEGISGRRSEHLDCEFPLTQEFVYGAVMLFEIVVCALNESVNNVLPDYSTLSARVFGQRSA